MARYNKYHNKKIEKYNQIWDSEMDLRIQEKYILQEGFRDSDGVKIQDHVFELRPFESLLLKLR